MRLDELHVEVVTLMAWYGLVMLVHTWCIQETARFCSLHMSSNCQVNSVTINDMTGYMPDRARCIMHPVNFCRDFLEPDIGH